MMRKLNDPDWILVNILTPEKIEVWQMSKILELHVDAVIGKLVRVWIWFYKYDNCQAPEIMKEYLNYLVESESFCDAMIEVGWMIQDNGVIFLPNIERHT